MYIAQRRWIRRWPDESVVVEAHYDTVLGSPGADDNAGAVAGLIEIARLLKGHRPARTLKVVAFVNEEPPFFFSARWAARSMRHCSAISIPTAATSAPLFPTSARARRCVVLNRRFAVPLETTATFGWIPRLAALTEGLARMCKALADCEGL